MLPLLRWLDPEHPVPGSYRGNHHGGLACIVFDHLPTEQAASELAAAA